MACKNAPIAYVESSPMIAWLAGIIEGEGWLGIAKSGRYLNPRIEIQMTDRDVVERAQAVVAAGSISARPPRHGHYKPSYRLSISGAPVLSLLLVLLPYLGERRRAKAQDILAAFATS